MCAEDFTPVGGSKTPSQTSEHTTKSALIVPPHNGFGSDEDSLGNCLSLLPKPPKRDFSRFMALDKAGYDTHVLRFLARLDATTPDPAGLNEQRRFIISFFLVDGTVSVFEQSSKGVGRYKLMRVLGRPLIPKIR